MQHAAHGNEGRHRTPTRRADAPGYRVLVSDPGGRVTVPAVVAPVLRWYDRSARDLPWRRPGTSPWAVMVSEFMLQQTPVSRVLGPWTTWMERWPTPVDLAVDPVGDAIRAWGRLGYPRRAIRLHAAAVAIVERHDGRVPRSYADLLALPGVGDYTAAAIASFAFGSRHVVLDTNVRRVLARVVLGEKYPGASPAAERRVAERVLPRTGERAARWAVASMELGALVCTARTPRCDECPLSTGCAWRAAGYPSWSGPARRVQPWSGTDRQCRGALMAVLREADVPVTGDDLVRTWPLDDQRDRCLAGLLSDGLVVLTARGGYDLPS